MNLTLCSRDDRLIHLQCEGNVTMSTLLGQPDPLEPLLGSGGFAQCVLINMEKTTFLDSHAIGWLLRSHKHCAEASGMLILHSIPPLVSHTLLLLRMDRVLHLVADEDAARQLALAGKEAKS